MLIRIFAHINPHSGPLFKKSVFKGFSLKGVFYPKLKKKSENVLTLRSSKI